VETASITTVIVAVLGIPMSYLLARGRGRTSALLGIVIQLPIALPPLMSGILLLYVVGPYTPLGRLAGGRLTDDVIGIVLAQIFVAAPFLIVAARSAFAAVDPALEDVAATLGHGRWARFVRVASPAAAPGISAGLLLTWLRAFGEFGATIVLAYNPYSLPVFTYVQFGSTGLSATLLPVAATLAAAFVVLATAAIVPRLRRPRHVPDPLPAPAAPAARASPPLDFDLTGRVGSFHLRLAYRCTSRRLAILGSSGAGKTFTLRMLAGLATPAAGHVRLGDDDLTARPSAARGIGYVPQDSSLLPHLPVWHQVIFGVGAQPSLAVYWLGRLHLTGLRHRRPDQLSGGQRRRVALARALARGPRLLLLDEPFTGLDTPIRNELRQELRHLQRDTSLITVLVTHDPDDAVLLADEILVLAGGRALQAGSRSDVFGHPASAQVARLLGLPNIQGGIVAGRGRILAGELALAAETGALPDGTPVTWCIRPDRIRLGGGSPGGRRFAPPEPHGKRGGDNPLSALITDVIDHGTHAAVELSLPGGPSLTAEVTAADGYRTGDWHPVMLPQADLMLWPADRPDDRSG